MVVIFINKVSNKSIFKFFCLIIFFICIPYSKADAAWNNNAVDFVNSKGQQTAYYEQGAFWFGQAGTVPTYGTYYQTMGWEVGVYVNGGYYSVGYKTRGTDMQVHETDYNSLRYTLWKIPFTRIVSDLKAKYPSVNFNDLQNRNVNSTFYFDAIVRVHFASTGWSGDINANGTTSWGTVYRTHYELSKSSNLWSNALIEGMKALFNISKDLPGNSKPPAPSRFAMLIEPNRPGWPSATYPTTHYHVNGSNDYWVNLKDRFTVYSESSIPESSYGYGVYPDYNYISLDLNGSTATGNSSSAYSGTISGVGPYFNNNFDQYSHDSSSKSESGSGYLFSRFVMRAKQDNKDYKLTYTSVKSGYYDSWTTSNKWLRTDGTSPTVKFNSDRVEDIWTKDNVNVTVTSEDGRSGVGTTKFWTQKDDGGWIWKGENLGTINLNTTGKHDIIVESIDNVKNSTGYMYKRYLIDKVKPLGKVSVENVTPDGFDVVVDGLYDEHSGLDKVTLVAWTTTWDGDGKWQEKKIDNSIKISRFRVKTSDYSNKCGKYYFDIRVFDKAGNELFISNTLDVPYPKPIVSTIDISNYEYKDVNNVYWVKADDPFTAKVYGKSEPKSSAYNINSLHAIIRKLGATDFSKIKAFDSYIPNNQPIGVNYSDFNIGTNTITLSSTLSPGSYSLRDNVYTYSYFNLYMWKEEDITINPMVRIREYNIDSDWNNNSAIVKSDGTAPTADSVSIVRQTFELMSLKINNLRDLSKDKTKPGSGVDFKNSYIEVQPVNYDGNLIGTKEKIYTYINNGDNNYTFNIDWNSSINKNWYGKFKIQIYVQDNVGNRACIYDKVLERDPITIQGVISPNPSPAGKLLDLQIKTTGSANRISVEFPPEILELTTDEENLLVSINIPVEPTHIQNIRSRLPLDTPQTLDPNGNRLRAPYVIKIAADNQYGDRASGILYLDVQESITTDVKVRIRSTGYDKGE